MKQKDEHIGQRIKSYNFIKKLGEGAWAIVYEVFDEKTRSRVACKVIKKQTMEETPKLRELVATEITVLQRCLNDNVIAYVDSFSNSKNVYIMMEYCNGGDMEQYLAKKGGRLRQDQSVEFLRQILNGFRGLHEVGALHRDFKAANILLHNGTAKIADLGFAKILKNQVVTGTILGTSVTMAPELFENKNYGVQCDVWSVGVVYYQFLFGDYPYNGLNDFEILKKIKKGPPVFPPAIPVSKQSVDFILKCLTIDPAKRITWKAIYEHPLLQDKMRDTYIGTLRSKIQIKKQPQKPVPAPKNADPFAQVNDDLTESADFDKIVDEVTKKNLFDQKVLQYVQLYLEKRNMIMLTLKHGITPIYELQMLPISHHLYAFLMCKRAYLEMSQLLTAIVNKANVFKIADYWAEFTSSEQYSRLFELLKTDNEMIYNYAANFLPEVKTKNPSIIAELNLKSTTPSFPLICKEELRSYSYQLFDYRNRPDVSKPLLMKLITFLCDLTNGIQMSSEQYNKALEGLDIGYMEDQFAKILQALYSGQKK